MADPTPTRAEVVLRRLREPAFGTETTERNLMAEAADLIAVLRERAEASERAEAAAWNDAIETAADACDKRGLKYAVPSIAATVADDCAEDIRALRRAAPTEDLT